MDAGPYSTGHAHEDKLSFILDAYGSHLIAETGIFTYDASAMREYFLGPAAHNTIFIDGLGQNRLAGPRSVQLADPSIPITWLTNPNFDFAEATFGHHKGERWGKDRLRGFIHTRRILFVKPTYFIVLDTITPPDGDIAVHTCEAIFHLDTAEAHIDPATCSVTTIDPKRCEPDHSPAQHRQPRRAAGQRPNRTRDARLDFRSHLRSAPGADRDLQKGRRWAGPSVLCVCPCASRRSCACHERGARPR